MRLALALCAVIVAALAVVPTATTGPTRRAPAIKYQDDQFGAILATRTKKALYYWNVEKRAGGKIRCRGACAKAWPPLIVKSRRVDSRIAGIRGRFATIRRPDGRYQVTFKGLPVYSYVNEGPEQVLCNDVDGWFVVKLR
jgi:predicted lipoprotein with Yx(FWY)xxD motif